MSTEQLRLRPLLSIAADAELEHRLPGTPFGDIEVYRFRTFDGIGDRWSATLNPTSAAEWIVTAPDGTATAHGRVTLTTGTSDPVYLRWTGRWNTLTEGRLPPRVVAMFEADGAAGWLNTIVAVGAVRHDEGRRRYDLFELLVAADAADVSAPCVLVELLELDNTVDLANVVSVPHPASGRRLVAALRDANVFGDRVRGRLIGSVAGDWATLSPERMVTMDVRETIETHDGALVHLNYTGSGDIRGGGVYSAPTYVVGLFATGDPRYTWLNSVLAVGVGRHPTGAADVVHYQFYEMR